MPVQFIDLNIAGAFISNLTLLPSKAVRMNLFSAPQGPTERQVVQEKHLQFGGVKRFRLVIDAKPWLEVKTHKILSDSDYLKNYMDEVAESERSNIREDAGPVYHFKIICDEGEIDIIAENFMSSLVDEIPFIAHPQIPKPTQGAEEKLQEVDAAPPQLICSFCCKQQSDLTRIITGPAGNICDECIQTCSKLLDEST